MKTKVLKNANLLNESLKSGVFATIFVFLSNVGGIRAIFEEQLKIYLFPFAAVTEVITTLLTFAGFINANNRNLGKTFDLILSLSTTALVLTAVIGGLWFGFAPLVVSSLFLAAIGSGALYNAGQFFYHAYRWLSSSSTENHVLKATYRNQTLKYGIASLIGLAIIVGVITTLMLPMAAPIVLLVGGALAATAITVGLVYHLYKAFNPSVVSEQAAIESTEHQPLLDNSPEIKQSFDYYNIQPAVTDKDTLVTQINDKINSLENQPQSQKRVNKLEHLNQIKAFIENPTDTNPTWMTTIKPGVFQSFFKNVGEVERISKAAESILKNLPKGSAVNTVDFGSEFPASPTCSS
jgi:hypothetical protein